MLKVIKIFSYFILFFTLLITISGIFFNVYFNKKLIEYVKEQISESSHNKYALSLDGITINIFTHSITVNNLIIKPTKKETNPKAQYVFKAKVLRIIDFSIIPYLRRHDLLIDRVEFEEPQISIFQGSERRLKDKGHPSSPDFSIYSAFSKKLNSISIGHIDIMNSKFNIYKNGTDTMSVFATNDNSISIKNFKVNSETDNKNRLFFAEKFEMVMNNFSYHLGSGLYTMYGRSLRASYIDSILIIDSLRLVPNFTKKQFDDQAGQQISRVKIISSKVLCKKMDVKLFFEYNSLVIHKMDLTGSTIDIFRDNTLPLKHIIRPSLQAMVKKLPFFVSVDSIEVKKAEVTFEIKERGEASSGKIPINKMDIIISGIQNDSSTFSRDQSIKVVISGILFNQGRFSETYVFPLKATKEFFYCSGSLTSMPLTTFNSMIPVTKNISIKSGQLDYSTFSFVAHENSSEGTMKFMYHDLKIEMINEEGKKSRLKEKLKTFLVNKFVVKAGNPSKDGIVRVSNIHAEHNPYRFFLYYSMQSILSGIEPTIVSDKKAKLFK